MSSSKLASFYLSRDLGIANYNLCALSILRKYTSIQIF